MVTLAFEKTSKVASPKAGTAARGRSMLQNAVLAIYCRRETVFCSIPTLFAALH
jgi:hypothetical protein